MTQANPEQQAVIDAGGGVYSVLAGPGAGKSYCLVQRYNRLIESGENPEDCLTLTFTNSAAKSMRERAAVQKTDDSRGGWMTFHALALSFCLKERENFGFELAEFPLCPEPLANKICWEVARRFEVQPRPLRNYIGLQKRNRLRPHESLKRAEAEHKDEKLALAYKAYETKLRENKVLDFDGLLLEMVTLLGTPPCGFETPERFALTARWQFKWLACDEAQDNDSLQIRLIQLMSQKHGNVLLVGDPGQNLYAFRGSSSDCLLNTEKYFPSAQRLYLGCNYRSTPEIVKFVQTIGPVPEMAEKFHTQNLSGPEPTITGYDGPAQEAADIARVIKERGGGGVAILSRTNRALRPMEDALASLGVKYRLLGKSGFWAQPEVKSCVAYLQCAIFPADYAIGACLRSPFWPTKYLKKSELLARLKARTGEGTSISYLREEDSESVQTFVRFLDSLRKYRDLPSKEAVVGILKSLKAIEHYSEEEDPDNSPVENLQELIRISGRFSSLKEFLDYTRRASAASKSKKAVALSTCHGAKGLEFNTVFLIQASEGILPHAKAESIEEESCVFFVACSRAERELKISYSGQPSRFLTPFLKKENDGQTSV